MPTPPLPDHLREVLAKPNPAVISTLRRDGHPVSVATWYLLDGDRVLVNMDATRTRVGHVRRDPRVSLTVLDEASWYNHISLIGRLVDLQDDEGLADIDRLSLHYGGRPYPNRHSPRVSAWLEIERWHAGARRGADMDLQLTGKAYVVTGGSRGLGFATARALVADGARVVLSARSDESLQAAVEELGPERATPLATDLADPTAAERLVDAATSHYGRLDGALLSVGGPPAGSVLETSDDQWTAAFESVFLGAVRASRVVVGALSDGGSLALVLSTSAKSPIPDLAISNGLRPGLGMVVKTLADEVGPRGIRVNGLLPGSVATQRVRQLDARADDPDARRRENEQGIPLRRYGEPDEFGRVAAFVLSPASSYVTGALIPVDGGALRPL